MQPETPVGGQECMLKEKSMQYVHHVQLWPNVLAKSAIDTIERNITNLVLYRESRFYHSGQTTCKPLL